MVRRWVAAELERSDLPDRRLHRRLEALVDRFSDHLGSTIPLAQQDWGATKAAYRFFSNPRVSEARILAGHFEATKARFEGMRGTALVLQDTTEFVFQREAAAAVGFTTKVPAGAAGRARMHTVCGVLMHSSLVCTTNGVPLGLAAVKFWTRKKFKGTNELKRHVNPTRIPIEEKESYRWIQNLRASTTLLGDSCRLVHIGDREGDIYELFDAARESKSHFLVRTCVDRLTEDGSSTMETQMAQAPVLGTRRVQLRDPQGRAYEAELELRVRRIQILPPEGKKDRYPPMELTVLHATERGVPEGREPIQWKLLTDLAVQTLEEAAEKLDWYALRWKIETYHKVLKSGCKAEELRLRTAERLTNAIAVFCILAWRVLWMTMVNRADPDAPASQVFTPLELKILDRLVPRPATSPQENRLSMYILKLARLGGFLARKGDGSPGHTVLWRGLAKLTDIAIGVELAGGVVGNG
jgi:Transposase DNA-binding/Transposase Tn5 dimerisation domain